MSVVSINTALPDRVGVRELRENLAVYVDRVKDGYSVTITEHGKPVGELRPLPGESNYDRLVREGVIIPAKKGKRALPLPFTEEELRNATEPIVSDLIAEQQR